MKNNPSVVNTICISSFRVIPCDYLKKISIKIKNVVNDEGNSRNEIRH